MLVRETSDVRIATWNLEGKWTPRHHWLIRSLRADLLLLTEVLAKVEIPGLNIHFTEGEMQPGRPIEMLRNPRSLVITRTDAALGVDPMTVTAGVENGTIPSVKFGRRVIVPRERFLKLFDAEA